MTIVSLWATLNTAASIPERGPGALVIFNDSDLVYLPNAESENPAHKVFDSPKVVNKAVVAASPLRYQDTAGTGLYKCILHSPIMRTPAGSIFEMRGSVFQMTAFDIETMSEEPIEVTGVICYILPRDGPEDTVAVWVNDEKDEGEGREQQQQQQQPESQIGTLLFVKRGSSNSDAADPANNMTTTFDGGSRTLKVAQVIDWSGRDEHIEPSRRGVNAFREPLCRLVGENGRTTGFTYSNPLYFEDSVPGTYVGVQCDD